MKKISSIAILVVLSLLFLLFTPISALELGPTTTDRYQFNPGDSISESDDWSGSVSLFNIVTASASVDASFYLGIALPFEIELSYPEWLIRSTSFQTSESAQGRSGGQFGMDIHAGIEITLSALGGLLDWDFIDKSFDLDLLSEFVTPIGNEVSDTLVNKIKLGGIRIPLVDAEIAAYFGVEVEIRLEGVLNSNLAITGSSLSSNEYDSLTWDYQGETHTQSLQTTGSASQSVTMSMDDIELSMTKLTIALTSFFLEFTATGFDPVKLSIGLPDFLSGSAPMDITYSDYSINPIQMPVQVPEPTEPIPGIPANISEDMLGLVAIGAIAIVVVLVLAKRRTSQ